MVNPSDAEPTMMPSFVKRTPLGDERERDMCSTCGFIDYRNPKVVVGCLPIWVWVTLQNMFGTLRIGVFSGDVPLSLHPFKRNPSEVRGTGVHRLC
jgi:hypothetical protein